MLGCKSFFKKKERLNCEALIKILLINLRRLIHFAESRHSDFIQFGNIGRALVCALFSNEACSQKHSLFAK